jgi:hypothetical protein
MSSLQSQQLINVQQTIPWMVTSSANSTSSSFDSPTTSTSVLPLGLRLDTEEVAMIYLMNMLDREASTGNNNSQPAIATTLTTTPTTFNLSSDGSNVMYMDLDEGTVNFEPDIMRCAPQPPVPELLLDTRKNQLSSTTAVLAKRKQRKSSLKRRKSSNNRKGSKVLLSSLPGEAAGKKWNIFKCWW